MENKEIAGLFKKYGKILELHDENVFKIRSFQNAAYNLDKFATPLRTLTTQAIAEIQGIGKSMAAKILEIITTNNFSEYQLILQKTPPDVIEMLAITGLGPKKVKSIWKDANIDTLEKLKTACVQNQLVAVKGISQSLQDDIIEFLDFKEQNKGKFFYADIENVAYSIENDLKLAFGSNAVSITGDVRRKMETIDVLQFGIIATSVAQIITLLDTISSIKQNSTISSPSIWRGMATKANIKVEIRAIETTKFGNYLYETSASNIHLGIILPNNKSIKQILKENSFATEQAIFDFCNIPNLVPEIREGIAEIALIKENKQIQLIENAHLKGSLHNHSTYSDGENTVEEMANACLALGLEYFGISDHSQTASYASGLKPEKVIQQHQEIDALNAKFSNKFHIFKGIESDILGDGSLDYSDEILQTFDFIVASVHANLRMDIHKATERLVRAIENKYTTILGHPTGRLLLRRKGYPIDYKRVIDACATHGVVIELNANPWRLDLDWRYIDYALSKNVMISINPDAHEIDGLLDTYFGVCVARKAGLTSQMCFNTKPVSEMRDYFKSKK